MDYTAKYLKYKNKYLNLKNSMKGGDLEKKYEITNCNLKEDYNNKTNINIFKFKFSNKTGRTQAELDGEVMEASKFKTYFKKNNIERIYTQLDKIDSDIMMVDIKIKKNTPIKVFMIGDDMYGIILDKSMIKEKLIQPDSFVFLTVSNEMITNMACNK